jgi:hypothetical protein
MAVMLWVALVAGPLAATIDQGLGYPLVKPSCADGSGWPLLAVSAVSLAISSLGFGLGWVSLARLRGARDDGAAKRDRSYFIAIVAVGFNGLIALLIVATAIPMFFLTPCE